MDPIKELLALVWILFILTLTIFLAIIVVVASVHWVFMDPKAQSAALAFLVGFGITLMTIWSIRQLGRHAGQPS